MFVLSSAPLAPWALADSSAGGYVTFEGRVRDLNEGRSVVSLEYEAFESMALSEGNAILKEAFARFPIVDARCSHRVGRLAVGDAAILVSVAAAHRSEAFEACRFIVDEVKHRLPIWKKEFYADGESAWVNCQCVGEGGASTPARIAKGEWQTDREWRMANGESPIANRQSPTPSPVANGRSPIASFDYSRQTILPEIGDEGQQELALARVLVVGAGGLGCPALQYLAAAGVGTIGISDGDVLDASNLHRQILFRASDVGKPKAELAGEAIRRLNPAVQVRLHEQVTKADGDVVEDYDLILDCTDNFEAKFLLSDLAVRHQKPLVQASIFRFEGHIHTYIPSESACLRCLWPDTPEADCTGTCAEVGVMGFTAGLFGVLQATEAIKVIVGFGETLASHTLIFDLLDYGTRRIRRDKNPKCPACGTEANRSIAKTPLTDMASYVVTPAEAVASDLPIIDIREHCEHPTPHAQIAPRWRHLPMSALGARLAELQIGEGYIVMCAHGVRSDGVVRQLRAMGDDRFYSLKGGDAELRRHLKG